MLACPDKVLQVRNAYSSAVTSVAKAFMVDGDDVKRAKVITIRPSVSYNYLYDDNRIEDMSVEEQDELLLESNGARIYMSFDAARDLTEQLTEVLDKLDKMEDKYLAALEKASKDKVEASREAKETFEF